MKVSKVYPLLVQKAQRKGLTQQEVDRVICWLTGYGQDGTQVSFIMGIPSWAVFGVFIPWILMVILTTIYGFFVMEGDEEE